MVGIGSNAKRERENYYLSRYGCYLIVQNADSSKKSVALGQTYFAIQTRKQEINEIDQENQKRLLLRNEMKTHNIKLADAAKNAGVIESKDYAIFQNHGYMGLYGGLTAKDIKNKKRLKKSQNILDHMGSTELAANLFRATQTEEKLRRENIKGKNNANRTHREVGEKVRQTIDELGGTMPEDLPSVESIKTIERTQNRLPNTSSMKPIIEDDTGFIDIEEQISATSENAIELTNRSFGNNYISSDIWELEVKKLTKEGRMALYAYMINSKAALVNEVLYVIFAPKQKFNAESIKKVDNLEYLKGFFATNIDENIKKIEVLIEGV